MSVASVRDSWNGKRKSVNRLSLLQTSISRSSSTARSSGNFEISQDDAFSWALRVAYLHHICQPRQKRREYAPRQKPLHRAGTSISINNVMSEFTMSNSSKLPHGFKKPLFDRIKGVMQGTEVMPGYSDPALKRFFGELYIKFTSDDTVKAMKDRKPEFLVLTAFARATAVAAKNAVPGDDSLRLLPPRHTAMFVRLLIRLLKDEGHERDRAKLLTQLAEVEKKLLTNAQDLSMDDSTTTKEVIVPLSYDVKDMTYVQLVCQIFGYSNAKAQNEINMHQGEWSEEAAMKDFKAYQTRLDLGASGTLQNRDFDVEESYEEWKLHEKRHLGEMMMEILNVRPDLAKNSSNAIDNPPPTLSLSSPIDGGSLFADSALSATLNDLDGMGFDPSVAMSNMNFDEGPGVRSVDDATYVFTPYSPRSFYKTVVQYAVTASLLTSSSTNKYVPFSKPIYEFLLYLATVWRVPQFSRHISLLEVVSRKYQDEEMDLIQVGYTFEYIQTPQDVKRPAALAHYDKPIGDIDSSKWTLHDFAAYKQCLRIIFERAIRELGAIIVRCYEQSPPDPHVIMEVIRSCIYDDAAFEPRPGETEQFKRELERDLKVAAERVYKEVLTSNVPETEDEWDFSHVHQLRLGVMAGMKRVQNYLANSIGDDEIEGVKPLDILIEKMFPSLEVDIEAIIKVVIANGKARGEEVAFQDGFDMYQELTKLRAMHKKLLPKMRFAFNIEEVFVDFVYKWLAVAEEEVVGFVEGAIKQDLFHVRKHSPDEIPLDSQRHSSSVIDMFSLFNQLIDQITQLKWQSELQKARFMTILSRIFSMGIGRYCEMVETMFVKEMEQTTERELALQSQSAQDRFMQLAREAISKPKAEVFQFPPEAFVRLNNIEYALQELDRLEKVMDVDACVATIERFEGPPKPPRKGSVTYIFTIKMIEAEDLKACDTSGYSDPYIILCDEHRKRLAKSRVISRTLNPRWDESVDITVHSTINVIATIWDHDMIGEHDFVGRAALKLDPQHFKDYLPREFWLDLDTQGRLLLRVSMEAERDDIQFHYGKAFRHLKRTERDMVRRITDKLNVEINDTLSLDALRRILKTGTGIGAQVVSFWRSNTAQPAPVATAEDIENALKPLEDYFWDNFALMKQTLTHQTMLSVMTRLWKQVLMALESLMVPPLSDKPSDKKPLTEKELNVVHEWSKHMYNFFNARGENNEVLGVPDDILKSPKYHEFCSLYFFYQEDTQSLIRESERMVAATADRQRKLLANPNRLSAPATLGPMAPAFGSMGTIRRGRSILMSRNLGTMRKAREEKRKEAQADPSDDGILRILRMRPEAAGYLKERSRQRERQESTAATVAMMQQGGMRMLGGFGSGGVPLR